MRTHRLRIAVTSAVGIQDTELTHPLQTLYGAEVMDSGRRIPQMWVVRVSLPAGFLSTTSCTILMTCSLYAAVKFMMVIANLFLLTQVITRPLLVPVSKNKRSLVSKSLPLHSLNYILEKPEWSFECAKAVTTLIFIDHLQVMHQN